MRIHKYSLGEMQANCYLLVQDKKCLMIDPGDNADFLLEEIQRQSLTLEAMLATHGHFDHIMGAGAVQTSIKKPLTISKKDAFLVARLKETVKYFLGYEPAIIMPDTTPLKEGMLKINGFAFEVLSTPGHTPGSSCFFFKDENFLFSGDTLFKDAVGRYDFAYGSKKDLKKSIEKLFDLPDQIEVYPGHGEDTMIGIEKPKELYKTF